MFLICKYDKFVCFRELCLRGSASGDNVGGRRGSTELDSVIRNSRNVE